MEYKGFRIDPKPNYGYEVIQNGINPMPGAVWFVSVDRAKKGIDALIESGGNPDTFWILVNQK